ncbi:hypothetical protein LguiA_022147 [Lonicera macranthoides]
MMVLNISDGEKDEPPKIFNVKSYGAVADGNTDNSKAFMKAWSDACKWKGRSRVLIPWGKYMVGSVVFVGPCEGSMAFLIKGTLLAPTEPSLFFTDHWISFRYVDQLVVKGGGYLDGQGSSAWRYNDCVKNPQCKPLPITMRFDFVTNSRVKYLRSINSKNAHFNLFGCNNVSMSYIRITAPGESPNTDGIHIGCSSNISIAHSVIGTGDDCISMVSGSENIDISDVYCGPGHGISIGSLGKGGNKEHVAGITIKNCTFNGTQNGVRIKTWAPSLPAIASDFTFQDISMINASNPIVIDQQYCPIPPCDDKAQSGVQISNVTFKDIRGVSSTKVAVTMKCSQVVPCKDVRLENINLAYNGVGGPASSWCSNVKGQSYGKQLPPGCL